MMKLKALVVNGSIVFASFLLTAGIAEIAARIILVPADYLSVEMVPNEALGAFPSASAIGHGFDQWGFRNRTVPTTADIVAIGDSHTYGNTARMEDSWPYVLANRSGRSVYNLALGGYGPNQYFYLLNRALRLKPRLVICGLYLGDDFENAFLITYGLEHWKYLRELPAEKVSRDRANIWEQAENPNWPKKIRLWLSRHSLVYQLVFHGPILGGLGGKFQIRAAHQYNPAATSLFLPEKHIEEAFLPKEILRRLDQKSEAVREGMRLTFKLLGEMNEICRRNHATFAVVVIPTKEMVFSDYLEHNSGVPLADVNNELLLNGRIAQQKTFDFLTASGIPYIDVLPMLQRGVSGEIYARSSVDMHPNKNGYRIIGEAVFEGLKNQALLQPSGGVVTSSR